MAIKTIIVKGDAEMGKEGVAGGAITPGHLVTMNSAGAIVVHATAGAATAPAFARENEIVGKGIDTAYATNDTVYYTVMEPGDEVYALVAANAAAIVIGDQLVSDGAGGLKKRTATPDVGASPTQTTINAAIAAASQVTIAKALSALDNSAVGTPARLLVEIV